MKFKIISFICLSIFCLNIYPAAEGDHFILGTEEGEGQIIYPHQIKEGPDGNIYVYDRSDAFIKIYSPSGKYLRRIGGKGQGPGEIQRADGANFGFTFDRKLYFTEFFGGHTWITIMELSGELNKVLHLEINKLFGINNSASLEDKGFIIELWLGSKPEKEKDYFLYRYPQALVHIDSVGRIISEIVNTNYFKTISSHDRGADQWLPFIPAFAWTTFENKSIIFSDGLTKNLKIYDLDGKIIREIETTLPEPEKVRDKDLDEWQKIREEAVRDKDWFNRYGRVIEKYKKSIYDKKPILNSIISTPAGNILVSSPWRKDEKIKYWLIDKRGQTLGQISVNSEMLRISKEFIFIMATDEDGNYEVICLKRIGNELEDFLRMKELKILE